MLTFPMKGKNMKKVSYKEIGLVNTKKMFAKAVKGGYAIPAFNFNTMEQMQAIVQAAVETKSPVITAAVNAVPKSHTSAGAPYLSTAATASARRSAPIVSGFG